MSNVLKVGDTIVYRPGFGQFPPVEVKVESMTVTEMRRDKYGDSVEVVPWELVEQNRVCMSLDNGHWTYSDQIDIKASRAIGCE